MAFLERDEDEVRLAIEGWQVRAAPGVDAPALARGVLALLPSIDPARGQPPAASLAGGELQRFRPHRAAFLLPLGPLGPTHVKVYRAKDLLELALEVVLPSRGVTSWRMGRKLRAAGVRTPEPLLVAIRKPLRVHRGTVLLTRPLESPGLLTDELKRLRAAGVSARAILREVARLAAALHDAGLLHGDFTASNVVLAGSPPAREPWLIDLDRAKDLAHLPAVLRRWLQCLDLRLLLLTTWAEVPRRAWLRLLAEYARARGLSRPQRRRLAARVLAARRGRIRLGARTGTIGGREPWR